MKEELFKKALEYLNAVELFAREQMPIFIEEILSYYTAYHIALIVLFSIISIIAVKFAKSAIEDEWYDDAKAVLGVFSLVSLLFLLPAITFNALDLIKICFAPRLYLIEILGKLI